LAACCWDWAGDRQAAVRPAAAAPLEHRGLGGPDSATHPAWARQEHRAGPRGQSLKGRQKTRA
jgi:hypothetical protein